MHFKGKIKTCILKNLYYNKVYRLKKYISTQMFAKLQFTFLYFVLLD